MTRLEKINQHYREEERKRRMRQRRSSLIFVMFAVAFVAFRLQVMPMLQKPAQTASSSSEEMQSDVSWKEILVNRESFLPEGYSVKLVQLTGEYLLDARIVEITRQMLVDAAADGILLQVFSAYRSSEQQANLYEAEVQPSKTLYSVQPPGASEHETGLALDIVSSEMSTLHETFEHTAAFQWLEEHASRYGFILRYPKDKQEVTGVIYEPWHYRYVGVEAAEYMKSQGICLEEYLQM